jgi:hypothetical protein
MVGDRSANSYNRRTIQRISVGQQPCNSGGGSPSLRLVYTRITSLLLTVRVIPLLSFLRFGFREAKVRQ